MKRGRISLNIFLRELKINFKSLLIWALAISALIIFTMSVFPTMVADNQAMEELLKQLPEGIIKAFGMDKISMNDILGYYATKTYLMVLLFGSIYAIIQGSTLLAKEESERTIEFLLAKPVTRNHIVTSKVLITVANILLFNLIVTLSVYLSLELFKKDAYSLTAFGLLAIAPFLVHLTFANLGLLLSLFLKNKKSVYSASIGFILGMYFLSIMAELKESFSFMGYLTPFTYGNAVDIIVDENIKGIYLLLMLAINVISLAVAYWVYNRKDILV